MPVPRTCLVAIFCLIYSTSSAFAQPGPSERVESAVEAILQILKDGSLDREARWERIGLIINERFDIEAMSQSILATNWKKATPEEKRNFVNFFSQYLENTYRKRIESYTDEEVKVVGEKLNGARAEVETSIVTASAEIPVIYKMKHNDDGQWYAYDVVIEGVSLVSNYRNTFAAIVKSEGMDGLISNLQRSIAKYKAEQAGEEVEPSASY